MHIICSKTFFSPSSLKKFCLTFFLVFKRRLRDRPCQWHSWPLAAFFPPSRSTFLVCIQDYPVFCLFQRCATTRTIKNEYLSDFFCPGCTKMRCHEAEVSHSCIRQECTSREWFNIIFIKLPKLSINLGKREIPVPHLELNGGKILYFDTPNNFIITLIHYKYPLNLRLRCQTLHKPQSNIMSTNFLVRKGLYSHQTLN